MEMTIFPPLLAVNLVSEHLLLLFSILIFAAVLVTKVGSRYGVPSLLLFLLLGMVAGEDVLGVRFDDFELAENIGHFAMTIILFTAGLETSFKETRPVVRQGALLSTAGVLLTILFSGVFIWLVSDAGGHPRQHVADRLLPAGGRDGLHGFGLRLLRPAQQETAPAGEPGADAGDGIRQ